MTSPDPVAVLREDCRAAAEDVLAAVRALDHHRRRFEAHLAALEELDPAAADALERELHHRLAAHATFPYGRSMREDNAGLRAPTPPGTRPAERT